MLSFQEPFMVPLWIFYIDDRTDQSDGSIRKQRMSCTRSKSLHTKQTWLALSKIGSNNNVSVCTSQPFQNYFRSTSSRIFAQKSHYCLRFLPSEPEALLATLPPRLSELGPRRCVCKGFVGGRHRPLPEKGATIVHEPGRHAARKPWSRRRFHWCLCTLTRLGLGAHLQSQQDFRPPHKTPQASSNGGIHLVRACSWHRARYLQRRVVGNLTPSK